MVILQVCNFADRYILNTKEMEIPEKNAGMCPNGNQPTQQMPKETTKRHLHPRFTHQQQW